MDGLVLTQPSHLHLVFWWLNIKNPYMDNLVDLIVIIKPSYSSGLSHRLLTKTAVLPEGESTAS